MNEIEINNKTYLFQELPNTENADILEFLVYLQELYNICRKLLKSLIRSNKKVKTTVGFVGAIIDRISENLISIMLLSSKGLTANTAIILTNLIELRTDLKYISRKPNKIEEWLSHEKKYKKPWNFTSQIKEMASNDEEIQLERFIYEVCSIAKHGNPAGIDIGFNIGPNDKGLFYNQNKEYRLTDYLYWTYVYTSDAIKSSLVIISKAGIKVLSVAEELEKVSKNIRRLFGQITTKKVMDYVYQEHPELRTIDKEIERLEIEKMRVKSEIEAIEKQINKS